ncbi:hypothetical protein PoB_003877300 [Plakobranchus ocellatus]|uniref:Uncharacterized protein n=1 Tax=Plakobranchus ocellatus TaxID=259542 RepID=A0AAV4B0L7_9GAST|nr:hypothetical protein PoB_003877300 [Plakobranchus ocellatus]
MVNSRHQECHESTSREKGLATTSDTVYREKSNYQSDMLEDSVPTGLQDQTEDESQNMSTANAKEVSRSQISCHKAANSFSDPSDVAFETDSQQQSGITSGTEKAMDASRKLDCAQNSDVENNTSTTNASSSKNTDQADIEKVVDMPKSPDQLLEIQALPAKPSFHRNVHKVLQLLHLDIHLGDIANIEAVVEDLLKSPDQLLELQSLRSKLDQLTGKVYRLLQLLNFDVSPGVSAEQAVEKTTRALREGAEACARLDKMKIKVYTLLKILDPNVNLGDVANIEQVVEDMISLHEQD